MVLNMNRRSLVLVSSLLAGTILSAEANPFKNLEGLENFLPKVPTAKSIPSPLTFQADLHTAAGVLHYAIDKDLGPVILLGLRNDEETYCNLGGKSDEEEQNPNPQEKSFLITQYPKLHSNDVLTTRLPMMFG